MEFSDKLNFLMNLTQTSNKELARELSVDRSLISLLRTGRRKVPKNHDYIRNMSAFFARHCTAEFQRYALAEMIGISLLRSSMPTDILSEHLEKWLLGDTDMVSKMIDGMEAVPSTSSSEPRESEKYSVSFPSNETKFYYGKEGRLTALQELLGILKSLDTPCPILVSTDDSRDWLFEDYYLNHELQKHMQEIFDRGFTLYQIMPSLNFLTNYVESLEYWLPLYVSERAKPYYYPRIRDNLYRHSTIILPGHCAKTVVGIGMGDSNQVITLTTDQKLVQTLTMQFQDYMALCKPALLTHKKPGEFTPCLRYVFTTPGFLIQKIPSLSKVTLPRELLEYCLRETKSPDWQLTYQMYLDNMEAFEARLEKDAFIEMAVLASAEEIRAGQVLITPPCDMSAPLYYTPETYILHLKNILRLMEQYENYYFLPCRDNDRKNYGLIVSENDMALLLRSAPPSLMLEIHRPEMVQACREHLLRMAEQEGFSGLHKAKIRSRIKALIQELKN